MNSPRDRVGNKVNDLFTAMDRLTRTVDVNHHALTDDDIAKIKKAIQLKTEILMDNLSNAPSTFKL